ncbi:acyl-CoA thioesterase [Paenibacillus psychroresistens]|uniref:Acyl-CoA thioesterase n=1 Tax=Paenibacillus psychroresistens TaxID=1778678 RepID=A0A6B8RQ30_9BACL|nr:thioesterase family protein [Paenibacillus psychroresistens]QGQ97802.1 acyl-CoA thioesterase [Paenibacillus psychroresistens]
MPQNWSSHPLRVRYQETDQMGVVYHANYLNWFEIGRTEWIRTRGMTYEDLEKRGLLLPLTDAEIKFRLPARYDDQITIYTKMIEYSNIRVRFSSEIRRNSNKETGASPLEADQSLFIEPTGELLVSGETRHVWVNRDWKAARIDKQAPDLFKLLIGDQAGSSD